MLTWLDTQGSQYLALGVITGFVAFALACHWTVQRWLPGFTFKDSLDLGETFSDAIGGMFALLFALVTVAAWQNFDRMNITVSSEANSLMNIYNGLENYPPELRDPCQALVRKYVHQVAIVEWPMLKEGRQDPVARELFLKVTRTLYAYKPSPAEVPLHSETLRLVSICRALRHDRIEGGEPFLDFSMWLALILSAVIYILFSCFYFARNARAYRLMVGFLGAALGLVFFMLLSYNSVFSGAIIVGPKPFLNLEGATDLLNS